MARQRSTEGFTLLELLLLLSIICMLSICFVAMPNRDGISLQLQMSRLKEFILQGQAQALQQHQIVHVDIEAQAAMVGEEHYVFYDDMQCTPLSFHFTEKGTISKAGSSVCRIRGMQKKLVWQLGSGQADVR